MRESIERAAIAGIVGATVIVFGGVITQVVQASGTVGTHQVSYPWTPVRCGPSSRCGHVGSC